MPKLKSPFNFFQNQVYRVPVYTNLHQNPKYFTEYTQHEFVVINLKIRAL